MRPLLDATGNEVRKSLRHKLDGVGVQFRFVFHEFGIEIVKMEFFGTLFVRFERVSFAKLGERRHLSDHVRRQSLEGIREFG